MSIKTRVKKLEEKSNSDFNVIIPRVHFFDSNGEKMDRTGSVESWPEEFQLEVRRALVGLDDEEPTIVERGTNEEYRGFRVRIDQACSDVCAATDQTGIFLHWGVKYL